MRPNKSLIVQVIDDLDTLQRSGFVPNESRYSLENVQSFFWFTHMALVDWEMQKTQTRLFSSFVWENNIQKWVRGGWRGSYSLYNKEIFLLGLRSAHWHTVEQYPGFSSEILRPWQMTSGSQFAKSSNFSVINGLGSPLNLDLMVHNIYTECQLSSTELEPTMRTMRSFMFPSLWWNDLTVVSSPLISHSIFEYKINIRFLVGTNTILEVHKWCGPIKSWFQGFKRL